MTLNESPRQYGLDPERYAAIDAELIRAEAYFVRLRDELGDAYTERPAQMVIDEIKRLRFELAREQRHQELGRRIRGES